MRNGHYEFAKSGRDSAVRVKGLYICNSLTSRSTAKDTVKFTSQSYQYVRYPQLSKRRENIAVEALWISIELSIRVFRRVCKVAKRDC